MKNECDIVSDLLFSYNDGVLSNTSKEFVEDHLKNCVECKQILEEIKKENNESKKSTLRIDYLKRVKEKINKKNIIISMSLILLIIIIMFNIAVYKNYNYVSSTMEVYLTDDITDEQMETIKNRIMESSTNIELEYISKEKALEQMKDKLKNEENILDGYENNNVFPASFSIKTDTEVEKIVDSIQNLPGIRQINTHIKDNPYALFTMKLMNK